MYYAHQYVKFYNKKKLLSLQTSDASKCGEGEKKNNRKVA